MNRLGPEAKALLDLARRARPAPELKRRGRSLLQAAIASGSVSAAAASAEAAILGAAVKGAGGSVLGSVLVGLTSGAAAGALTSAVALTLWSAPTRAPAPPAVARPVSSVIAPVGARERARTSVPEPPPPPANPARAPAGAGASSAPSIERETALLAEAHGALGRGQPQLALQKLDRYSAEFARGVMAEEAMGARIIALCTLGRITDGRRWLEAFLSSYPRSPLIGRVGAACANAGASGRFRDDASEPQHSEGKE